MYNTKMNTIFINSRNNKTLIFIDFYSILQKK